MRKRSVARMLQSLLFDISTNNKNCAGRVFAKPTLDFPIPANFSNSILRFLYIFFKQKAESLDCLLILGVLSETKLTEFFLSFVFFCLDPFRNTIKSQN